ncbi:helix-turn-helix transcriptional regulator [Spirosoma montaniterrae]|uniref:Transcriptional regulator n=1 Tax=Spirosoma montaniterrae TaxID=1178516 RepID=A0A1P9X3X7_9BACT|nr:AraC family transcriptional regulator [Spirosoma montaniterrae]AQG82340.1 transcriptional regulator [Spirosoma montaniterrae]
MKIFRRYFSFADAPIDNTASVNIHTLGHHIHPTQTPYPDIRHPDSHFFDWERGRSLKEYQLLYVCKGEGIFEAYGMPPQVIEEGTIILLYPGVWHRYKPNDQTGWEEYWVGFSGDYPRHLLEQECFNPQSPIIKVGFNVEFLATFERLFEVVEVREDSYLKLASFLVLQLLGVVYTSVLLSNQKVSRKEKIISDVKRDINERWQETIDFERLSDACNVSYAWLRKAFKETTGTSLNQYHLRLKLHKAEELIRDTGSTLSEISAQCGFESVHYFSRIYKQKMHINPSEIRRGRQINS